MNDAEKKALFKKRFEKKDPFNWVKINFRKNTIDVQYNLSRTAEFNSFDDYIRLCIKQNQKEIKFLKSLLVGESDEQSYH